MAGRVSVVVRHAVGHTLMVAELQEGSSEDGFWAIRGPEMARAGKQRLGGGSRLEIEDRLTLGAKATRRTAAQ